MTVRLYRVTSFQTSFIDRRRLNAAKENASARVGKYSFVRNCAQKIIGRAAAELIVEIE